MQYFNVPMIGSSPFKLINQIEVNNENVLVEKNKKTLWSAYHRAKMFEQVSPILYDILECQKDNLAEYLEFSIRAICKYLEINTKLYISSNIHKSNELHGEDKVIDICKSMGADIYYNAIGGKELYHSDEFKENGIQLYFLKTGDIVYQQGTSKRFEANLSIIDVMMNNDVRQIKQMLQQYTLVE